ncbi:uncharacterized protein TRAVEDRAFT_122399 [Trametes versicolor FP-101664 SS1]|uniref:uncharacterized protein n=1 Tax=Trametes versicolor (strain FP-101664) TaxID=717944 RepID=UPI0004623DB5|nr:uncharacterized protein TRAVEDRAFT_122399 [Trametes versicolor FP-101664 SS1]EIW59762.1 hypothetical protein TRAVEDRAFT_122399 [Trametes versicolor FP-101664 SS1]
MTVNQEEAFRYFWAQHCPVVVYDVHAKLQGRWTPDAFIESHGKDNVSVIDSSMPTATIMSVEEFFKLFTSDLQEQKRVVKMKDWPPSAEFRDLFPTQFDAFMDAIPMSAYTRHDGYLNLSSHWPFDQLLHLQLFKPDLGPKAYLASPDHLESGSTPLHLDVTSAVNLLVYVHGSPPGVPGALWHIFPAHVTPKLRSYLREVTGDSSPRDPIHAQTTYLTRSMRDDLIARGIEFFEIFQKLGDAVFIPAGCAHQVSNLRPCIKIACDFVCVEGIPASLTITQEFRAEPREDILNMEAMLWHAWRSVDLQLRYSDNLPRPNAGAMQSVWRRKHVANRRAEASEARKQGPAAEDRSRDYRCLIDHCAQADRHFVLGGIFDHM